MNKTILLAGALLLWHVQATAQTPVHHPRCGLPQMQAAMIARDPSWADRFAAQKAAMQAIADNYALQKSGQAEQAERTTTQIYPVPIIFHIVVDSAQFYNMGGTKGIATRCDSQIAVLNRDYNEQNPDSTQIPTSWKPLYANPGIHFGLAGIDPNGNPSTGYEVKIITGSSLTDAGFTDPNYEYYTDAKSVGTGLAAWDNTKYYNVWCINFTGSDVGLLGITTPLSFTGNGGAPVSDEGACILYNTLGCTAPDGTPPPNTGGTAGWSYPYNLGRTLTHETGHMFEIWHPWGDDGGLCPWFSATQCGMSGTGADDGLADTPPESDATYDAPTYNIIGGTINDCCQMHGTINTQPIGIACLSYMDYTNDNAMHMFTTDQANAMAAMVLQSPSAVVGATGSGTVGENYSLTQHPGLLLTPSSVPGAPMMSSELNIFPNPTTGLVTVTLNSSASTLNRILVINLLGQEVMTINGGNKDYYTIDLSGMAKGIYFVQCNFASGSITRKILLQ